MPIWKTIPVDQEPVYPLETWQVYEVPSLDRDGREHHFVGRGGYGFDPGRVSSRIVEFDKERMVGITRSGRKYELQGPPGHSRDGNYVFDRWLKMFEIDSSEVKDVTEQYLRP
jgi:hypothetical protein